MAIGFHQGGKAPLADAGGIAHEHGGEYGYLQILYSGGLSLGGTGCGSSPRLSANGDWLNVRGQRESQDKNCENEKPKIPWHSVHLKQESRLTTIKQSPPRSPRTRRNQRY
jgi:hypothetical protein